MKSLMIFLIKIRRLSLRDVRMNFCIFKTLFMITSCIILERMQMVFVGYRICYEIMVT